MGQLILAPGYTCKDDSPCRALKTAVAYQFRTYTWHKQQPVRLPCTLIATHMKNVSHHHIISVLLTQQV